MSKPMTTMLSNGTEAKVGTLGSKYAFFHEWKRLKEDEEGSVALETMLRGICNKRNLMDLFENFILFDHSGGHTAKILARNHQYLGVNEAVEVYRQRKLRDGKLGVFWHTQGSGKSYSMLFLAQKIRRKFDGSPTFVVLTDREELNTQISDTFENCGMLGNVKASKYIAQSGEDLIHKLKSNPSFIFTLIQKFNQKGLPPITPNYDIIIMSDEAHRSQNGIFAENMMALLPTASRIGFTGTPLFSNDSITERTFGGYISIYDFKRAVEDGATVPLYYENRGEKLGTIQNPEITQEIMDAIEAADLDVSQQEKLEREFAKEIHILTAQPRLDAIARDFVEHYTNAFLREKGFSLAALVEAKDFAKQALIRAGADAVCGSMEEKKEFQTYASEFVRVMKYLQRDDLTEQQLTCRDAIVAIYKELQAKRKHADNTDLMVEINRIVSESLALEPTSEGLMESKRFDISKIDFDLLHREFAKAANKGLIIKDLTELVEERLKQMLRSNPARIDYYERYQSIIEQYNAEKDRSEIERIFDELTKLAQDLSQEEKRYVREGFSSDEELSVFDLLFKEDLNKKEIEMIKKVAVDLLAKVKAKISELDHWTDKTETKAIIDNLIRDTLWAELPESYDELSVSAHRQEIYQYIYMRYKDAA
ncbi:MAG: DEAD/DEAH box helicase family protein [Clostridiales bacterium]|nr:DEAD/DEAH box helicase family protein [Clostridiales bacterium]